MNKEKLKLLVDKLYTTPFPGELPGEEMIVDFDLEDSRIVGIATNYLNGDKVDKIESFNQKLKELIMQYKTKDEYSQKIHQNVLERLNILENVIELVNNCAECDNQVNE